MLLPSILRFSVCNFTFFFFNDTATTEIYTLSLHDALPISPEFPNGLANSSGELGRNLMDHTMGGGASGTLLGLEERRAIGNRPNGIYVPRFRNVKSKHSGFLRGYGFQGGAVHTNWRRGIEMSGFGADFKHI